MALIRAKTYLQRAVNQLFISSFMSKSRGTIAFFQIVDNSVIFCKEKLKKQKNDMF
jgi:hypothetical protein